MSTTVVSFACAAIGAGLVAVGLWLGSWWAIAGGMVALVGAAWVITEVR